MKTLFTLFLLIAALSAFPQDQNFEDKVYLKLKSRAEFYEVSNKRQLFTDSVFSTYSGFLVDTEWITVKIGDVEYVIVTYPRFKNRPNTPRVATDSVGATTVYQDLGTRSGKTLAIEKSVFDTIPKTVMYSTTWWKSDNYKVAAGQLTLPFKFRPKTGDRNFSISTDVTVGAYIGVRKRLSSSRPFYLTVPATIGLSFINVNENTTTPSGEADFDSGVYPGITWSTGLILQLDNVNVGLVTGRDFASQIGDDWIYHNKQWFSFAIGFSFLK